VRGGGHKDPVATAAGAAQCGHCAEWFAVTRPHRRFCSERCRKAAHNRLHYKPVPPPTLAERFWRHVTKSDGCWIWNGTVNKFGYGQFGIHVDGKWKPRGAHRIAYELSKGPIPEGLQLDHLCRNRRCVNPSHLEPVSNRENSIRGMAPAMQVYRTNVCLRGHKDDFHVRANGKRYCLECARTKARERYHARGR
jgi:hypothetical protein